MEAPVFKIEFEFINPTNIESEVPGKQEIREGDANEIATQDSTLDLDSKVENPNDYILSPVITVTKQESEFTKGDLKLQKISVTENISEEREVINGAICYTNSNPNIHDEVIRGPQPLRVAGYNNRVKTEEDMKEVKRGVKTTEHNIERGHVKDDREAKDDDSKTKTRIPTLKLKQAAQAVRERRSSSDRKDEVPPPRLMQKRSSIPRLKDSRIPPPLDRRSSRTDIKMETDIKVETPQPEDEFEKIYDEIIVTEPKEVVIETIENIKVEDPEKLENKFEEIIHDYEENKVHPITDDIPLLDKPRSKIPLSKRKSEQEIKIPKAVERISVKKDEPKAEKQINESRIPMHKEVPHKFVRSKSNIPRSDDTPNKASLNKVVISRHISIENPNQVDLKPKNINVDPVKVVKREVIEIEMEKSVIKEVNKPNTYQEDYSPEKTKVIAETKPAHLLISQDNVPIVDKLTDSKIYEVVDETKPIEQKDHAIDKSYETEPEKENNNSKEDDNDSMDLEYKPGKVSRLLQRIRSQEFGASDTGTKKQILIDIPKKKSVLSKISMFERQDSDEAPVLRLPRSNKLPIKKPKEIKVETMQEEVVDRKPIIVDELLKDTNIDSTVHDVRVDYLVPEEVEHKTNKDYKVEIEEEAVKYVEVQMIDPIEEIKIDDIKNMSPIINGTDKPVVKFTPSTPRDTGIESLISKFDHHSVSREEIAESISIELLRPPIENFDEKVPREIVIETLEYKPTEYEIKTQICSENEPILFHNRKEILNYETNVNHVEEEIPIESITLQETEIETLEFASIKHSYKVDNSDEVFGKESKVEKWRRLNENEELKKERPKSVAELDLGDAVRGKVHQLIVRMNSNEKMENNKKQIDPRERPRKKSVSKIIALFEQRSVLIEPPTSHKPDVTTKLPSPPKTLSEEEYQPKIAELVNGKVVYGRVENMTYIVLNNGVEMPVLAVGTALLDKRLIRPVIESAIDMGYRAIDSAYIYGNEKEVGEAIRAKIDDGTVTREDLFIINKLWSTFHRSDLVSKACQASLRAMGLQYFDLYLIHNPVSFKEGSDPIPKIANVVQFSSSDFMDAWFGMEELVSKGLVKSIGVSNFNSRQIQRVLDKARVKPVINQVECHPYLSQDRLDEFCSARDIKLSCFGVLGSKGTPTEFKSGLPPVIDDPLVQVMAAGLNITPAQLLIRYQIDSGHNVVVKASSAAHLWDNLQALQVSLEPAQVQALRALNRNKRIFTFVGIGDTHRNYPFKIPF